MPRKQKRIPQNPNQSRTARICGTAAYGRGGVVVGLREAEVDHLDLLHGALARAWPWHGGGEAVVLPPGGRGRRTRRRVLPGCGDGVAGVEAEAEVGVVVSGAAARPRRWSSSSSRSEAQSSMRVGSRRSILPCAPAIDPRQARVRHVRGGGAARLEVQFVGRSAERRRMEGRRPDP